MFITKFQLFVTMVNVMKCIKSKTMKQTFLKVTFTLYDTVFNKYLLKLTIKKSYAKSTVRET